jgi:hypothetical protein
VHVLTPQQVAAWKAAFQPVYKDAVKRIPGPIVPELLKEAGIKA